MATVELTWLEWTVMGIGLLFGFGLVIEHIVYILIGLFWFSVSVIDQLSILYQKRQDRRNGRAPRLRRIRSEKDSQSPMNVLEKRV